MKKVVDKTLQLNFSNLQGFNAHVIVASFRDEAHKAGWNNSEITNVVDEMMSDDYDHLWDVICLYSETPNSK